MFDINKKGMKYSMKNTQVKGIRKLLAVLLALILVFSTGISAFGGYEDINVSAPSIITVEKGKPTTLKIPFKGVGIGYVKGYMTSGISAKFTNVTWKAYPEYCFAILSISHARGVNMRSEASTSGKKLTAIPYKTKVTVTQVKGNWGKVSYGGKTGWICLDYCKKEAASENKPANTSAVPAKVRVSQMNGRSCTCAAVTTLVRAKYYADGKNYENVTESKIRNAGWTSSGLKNSFSFNGLKIRSKYISGSTANKEVQLRNLLKTHPEGIVIYGWNNNRSHAVYLGTNFKVLDPAVNASKNYITIDQSFIPGSGLSNVQKVWYIEK